MAKDLNVGDFPVAPRRSQARGASPVVESEGQTSSTTGTAEIQPVVDAPQQPHQDKAESATKPKGRAGLLTEEARASRQTREQTRRSQAADSRDRLRNLARVKTREIKHFVNVPLDGETKARLERAAHENGLKMTVIMKDAIATYLEEAGY